MPAIDRWVLHNTMRYLRTLPRDQSNWLCVMNLSGQSLCDDRFLDFVLEELQSAGIGGEHICFEITRNRRHRQSASRRAFHDGTQSDRLPLRSR